MLTRASLLGILMSFGFLAFVGPAPAQQYRLGFAASTATWNECGIVGKQFICVWDKATPDLKRCAGFFPIDPKKARLAGAWCEDPESKDWCADHRGLVAFADSPPGAKMVKEYNISSDVLASVELVLRTWSDKIQGFPFSDGLEIAHLIADKAGKAYGAGTTPREFVASLPVSDP